MGSECVYDCVHILWGGHGNCVSAGGDDPSVCSCDAGYASRGATGHPNCVPTRVLVAAYAILTAVSVVTTALLGWHMAQFRHLSARWRSSRKTATRMRALVGTGIYTVGSALVGVDLAVQAGDKGYFDHGIIEATYTVLLPSMMFGVAMMAENWVTNLPFQLIASGSVADKLAGAAAKYNLFVIAGCLNSGMIAAFGVTAFVNPITATNLADAVIAGEVVAAMTVITFVAVQITGYISQAALKASPSSREFYAKAKRRVGQQATALCGVGVLTLLTITTKYLSALGRNSPIIFLTFQLITGHIAGVVFALATRFPDTAAAKSPRIVSSLAGRTGREQKALACSEPTPATLALSPLTRPSSERKRGGWNNVGATTSQSEEKSTPNSARVEPSDGGDDGIAPGGKAPVRRPPAANISRVVPL